MLKWWNIRFHALVILSSGLLLDLKAMKGTAPASVIALTFWRLRYPLSAETSSTGKY